MPTLAGMDMAYFSDHSIQIYIGIKCLSDMPTPAGMGMAYFNDHSNLNYKATKTTLEFNV